VTGQLPSLFLQCCREATKCCNSQKGVTEDTNSQYNVRRCNCSHRTRIPTGLSLTGKSVFSYDLSESECFIMSSRGEDEMRTFSFAKPPFYWVLLFWGYMAGKLLQFGGMHAIKVHVWSECL